MREGAARKFRKKQEQTNCLGEELRVVQGDAVFTIGYTAHPSKTSVAHLGIFARKKSMRLTEGTRGGVVQRVRSREECMWRAENAPALFLLSVHDYHCECRSWRGYLLERICSLLHQGNIELLLLWGGRGAGNYVLAPTNSTPSDDSAD
jgi:hypothetical protein